MQPTAPAPDAVWSRYGDKRHLVIMLVGVLVFAGLTVLGYNAFASGDVEDGAEKVIGGIITGFFAVGLVFSLLAVALFPFRRRRLPGVAIDAAGVWWYRERGATLVPWADVAGVGVGYLRAPSAAAVGGSSFRQPKDFTLEVFLRAPDLPEGSALRTWSVTEPAPNPALPADRLRFAIPAASDRRALHAAVTRYAPRLWAGEYERQWTRLGMFGK